MLKNTAGTKKRSIENSEKLREERAQDVPKPTKIFAFSSSGDQRPTKNLHPHLYRKERHRSNQPYKRKYSKEFSKLNFTCILINNKPRPSMCCLLRDSYQREPKSREIEAPSHSKAFEFH